MIKCHSRKHGWAERFIFFRKCLLGFNENRCLHGCKEAIHPSSPSDKQYQLWALIGSKPVDLGSFDVPSQCYFENEKHSKRGCICYYNRRSLAIPQGGPDLEQLRVMGKAKALTTRT